MPLDREALQALETDSVAGSVRRRRRRVRRVVVWLIAAAVLAGAVAWWRMPRAVTVTVARAATRSTSAVRVLNASGYVVARRKATVSAKTTGKLMSVSVEEGMRVHAGQVVARLEDDTVRDQIDVARGRLASAKAGVGEAQARLTDARLKLKRTSSLARRHMTSAASLDQARADYEVARASLAAAHASVKQAQGQLALEQQALDDTYIRAPFPGVVVSKDAQAGEIVSPISAGGGFTRTGICTIVDMHSLEIEVDVNEAYIQRVHDGQRAEAILNAYPEWRIPAHVINIVPTANREKSTVKVRIGFDHLDPRILPEMGVQVWFLAARDKGGKAVFVPTAALHSDNGSHYVYVLRDDRAQRVKVTVGGVDGADSEIRSGLSAGAPVIVSASKTLSAGERVRRQGR